MNRQSLVALSLGLVVAGGGIAAVSVHDRPPASAGITLFADGNYEGTSATFRQDVPNLGAHGLDDKASSVRVGAGEQWELCADRNYLGRCVVVSADEARLETSSWGDVVSSIRRARPGSSRSSSPGLHEDTTAYIVLFEEPRYQGLPRNYRGPASGGMGRVQSVTIGRGVWQLCDGARFSGRCVVVDRSVPDLDGYGLNNRVASVRPIDSTGRGRRTLGSAPLP